MLRKGLGSEIQEKVLISRCPRGDYGHITVQLGNRTIPWIQVQEELTLRLGFCVINVDGSGLAMRILKTCPVIGTSLAPRLGEIQFTYVWKASRTDVRAPVSC